MIIFCTNSISFAHDQVCNVKAQEVCVHSSNKQNPMYNDPLIPLWCRKKNLIRLNGQSQKGIKSRRLIILRKFKSSVTKKSAVFFCVCCCCCSSGDKNWQHKESARAQRFFFVGSFCDQNHWTKPRMRERLWWNGVWIMSCRILCSCLVVNRFMDAGISWSRECTFSCCH